jgi:hypothetical protein
MRRIRPSRSVYATTAWTREAVQASAEQLKSLREKRWDTIEILTLPSVYKLYPKMGYNDSRQGDD